MVTSKLPLIQHRNFAKSQKICAVIQNSAGVLEGSIKLLPVRYETSPVINKNREKKVRCKMKLFNCYKMKWMLVGFVAAIVLGGGSAKADFVFGEPTNLGPKVNSSSHDGDPSISSDGLELYFVSYNRHGGFGNFDIWVSTRATTDDPWGEPANLGSRINSPSFDGQAQISADDLSLFFVSDRPGGSGDIDIWISTQRTSEQMPQDYWGTPINLGSTVNSPYEDGLPCVSADGLELYFYSNRPGGYGGRDLWVTTRATKEDPWSEPVNLGPTVNSPANEASAEISDDGLVLFFASERTGGYGSGDLWLTKRKTRDDAWELPANLGPKVNTAYGEFYPSLSPDGLWLYFSDYPIPRPGGYGGGDMWQVSILPVVDFNGDRIVDAEDMCIMVDHWGTDYSLCDIGPMPWGDGVVDVEDLIVLAEHLFEQLPGRPINP
jgi:Tol biopolymer transport system component